MGRPKGKREATMSLRPVAAKLAELLGQPVAFVDDCIGETVEQAVAAHEERRRDCCSKTSVITTKRKPTIRRSPKNWRRWPMFM